MKFGDTDYVPDEGDIVWLNFEPQAGREQKGKRPAIIISPFIFNKLSYNLAIVCPITNQVKKYPFEVELPAEMKTSGVILVNHIKSLDWKARNIDFIEKAPEEVMKKVYIKLAPLFPGFKAIL